MMNRNGRRANVIAPVRAVLTFALVLLFAPAAISAKGIGDAHPATLDRHPLVPSERATSADTIFDQGVPPGDRSVSRAATSGDLREGRELYDTHCVTCHGANLQGSSGVPSLQNAGGAATDFYLITGRMPGAARATQAVHMAPHFTRQQIDALDAYITSRAKRAISIPTVTVNAALLQHGRSLYEEHCQACHGAGAEGATAGYGWIALPLYRSTPTEVAEAIRIGPGVMPRFNASQLSARDVDAIATYVHALSVEPQRYGGLTMDYLGPTAEGLIGGILGVGALFWVIFFTGTKADGTRLHERP